jgi:hypothetical protein
MIAILYNLLVSTALAANPINFLNLPERQIDTQAGFGLVDFVNRIIEILLSLAYPLAFASIVYSAYVLISSNGNPDAFTKVKKNILYMVTGLFLIIFSVFGIRFLAGLLRLA